MLNNTTVTFAGNIVTDPELRFTTTGKAVAEFRVLVNRRTKNNDTDQWEDAEPTGHTCKVWGKPAEHVAESAPKGTRVIVHGHVETEAWTNPEGEKRTRDVVNVDEVGLSLAWTNARVEKVERTQS